MGRGYVKHNKADLSVMNHKVSGWVFRCTSSANKVAAFKEANLAFQTRLIVTSGIFLPHSSCSSSS